MTENEPHEKVYRRRRDIFFNNIIGGFGWAIGATIGLSLIFIVLSFILKNVNLVPVVGAFVGDVIEFVFKNNPNLAK